MFHGDAEYSELMENITEADTVISGNDVHTEIIYNFGIFFQGIYFFLFLFC